MVVTQLNGSMLYSGLISSSSQGRIVKHMKASISPQHCSQVTTFSPLVNGKRLDHASIARHCNLSIKQQQTLFSFPAMTCRSRKVFTAVNNRWSSDCSMPSADVEEGSGTGGDDTLAFSGNYELLDAAPQGTCDQNSTDNAISQLHSQDTKQELMMLFLPAIAGQAIDPLAQLMETAYIGQLGSVELASAGVSISIFNIISKLFNIPLLSVATSFVAEDIAKSLSRTSTSDRAAERQQLSSVSTALLLAVGIGIFEAVALSLGSGLFLNLMGISLDSSMHASAQRFLILRSFGAPAVVVSLALQGVFRGFKDTKTPVFCLGIGNFTAIFLFPILMYHFQLGVTGAAISTVLSQYIVTFLMIWLLNKRAVLLPPKLRALQFSSYIKSGGFLLGRTLATLTTMTLATSMAARQGPLAMAAHQICLQVWLAVSLLTDALAASGQALIASYLSKRDYSTVKEIAHFVLKIGLVTGVILALVLGVSFSSLASLFTKDTEVLKIIRTGVLFVSASQPINSLAFIFDGLHYGVSDFPYAAQSMMLVGAISSAFLLYAPSVFGLPGVWSGLVLFMGLRMMAGYYRLLSKTGPWWFLHADLKRTQG